MTVYGLYSTSTPVLGIATDEGMDISGVLYNYKVVKDVEDDFVVTVQNKDAEDGYIFQDTEDWSGKHGMRIQKVIPLPYTPIEKFGDGSIETTGTGTIEDATVIYMYRWDECRNPQNNENCPGYVPIIPEIPKIEVYDALVKLSLIITEYKCNNAKKTHEIDPETKNNFGVVLNPIIKNKKEYVIF